jgi:hypothetical protein
VPSQHRFSDKSSSSYYGGKWEVDCEGGQPLKVDIKSAAHVALRWHRTEDNQSDIL